MNPAVKNERQEISVFDGPCRRIQNGEDDQFAVAFDVLCSRTLDIMKKSCHALRLTEHFLLRQPQLRVTLDIRFCWRTTTSRPHSQRQSHALSVFPLGFMKGDTSRRAVSFPYFWPVRSTRCFPCSTQPQSVTVPHSRSSSDTMISLPHLHMHL